jgi:hypothetical protein
VITPSLAFWLNHQVSVGGAAAMANNKTAARRFAPNGGTSDL